jgi:murein DD-endopeptidase MepM/ murein hydrolase activator NlpD
MKPNDATAKGQIFFAPVVPFDWTKDRWAILDFTAENQELTKLDLPDTASFSDYVFSVLRDAGAVCGVGGYNEHRILYRRSLHFNAADQEPREIHLGIDIWAEAGTPVSAPLDGTIHSFQDNARFGDYGPTIILEHRLNDETFYTLYGHLSGTSLIGKKAGQVIPAGEVFAEFGTFPENGDWPPHLHFQVIRDLQGYSGDYPGVCALSRREEFLVNCPDPNRFLGIPGL